MKVWNVTVDVTMTFTEEVEAETKEEAMEQAEEEISHQLMSGMIDLGTYWHESGNPVLPKKAEHIGDVE